MAKNVVWFIAVLVVGAILGSFLGKLIGIVIPHGPVRDLFLTDLTAGLNPSTFDFRIVEFTIGAMVKINLMAIIGIFCAGILFKKLVK